MSTPAYTVEIFRGYRDDPVIIKPVAVEAATLGDAKQQAMDHLTSWFKSDQLRTREKPTRAILLLDGNIIAEFHMRPQGGAKEVPIGQITRPPSYLRA